MLGCFSKYYIRVVNRTGFLSHGLPMMHRQMCDVLTWQQIAAAIVVLQPLLQMGKNLSLSPFLHHLPTCFMVFWSISLCPFHSPSVRETFSPLSNASPSLSASCAASVLF
ncbi:hypothetical protein E2542_SST03470 [Spatholobus suberectus]|nr:hypothetical protein E2542_SST03470 [Spatholobus suberectus]